MVFLHAPPTSPFKTIPYGAKHNAEQAMFFSTGCLELKVFNQEDFPIECSDLNVTWYFIVCHTTWLFKISISVRCDKHQRVV